MSLIHHDRIVPSYIDLPQLGYGLDVGGDIFSIVRNKTSFLPSFSFLIGVSCSIAFPTPSSLPSSSIILMVRIFFVSCVLAVFYVCHSTPFALPFSSLPKQKTRLAREHGAHEECQGPSSR